MPCWLAASLVDFWLGWPRLYNTTLGPWALVFSSPFGLRGLCLRSRLSASKPGGESLSAQVLTFSFIQVKKKANEASGGDIPPFSPPHPPLFSFYFLVVVVVASYRLLIITTPPWWSYCAGSHRPRKFVFCIFICCYIDSSTFEAVV